MNLNQTRRRDVGLSGPHRTESVELSGVRALRCEVTAPDIDLQDANLAGWQPKPQAACVNADANQLRKLDNFKPLTINP